MDNPDPILHWSMISSEIELEKRAAKERILSKHGISKESLDELKILVMDELERLGGKTIKNEYGEIRGYWPILKDRAGNTKQLKCSRCYIIPKEKR